MFKADWIYSGHQFTPQVFMKLCHWWVRLLIEISLFGSSVSINGLSFTRGFSEAITAEEEQLLCWSWPVWFTAWCEILLCSLPSEASVWGQQQLSATPPLRQRARSFDGFYREWWLKSSLKTDAALVFMFTEYSSDGRRCQWCSRSKIFPWTLEWNVCLCVLIWTEQSRFLY